MRYQTEEGRSFTSRKLKKKTGFEKNQSTHEASTLKEANLASHSVFIVTKKKFFELFGNCIHIFPTGSVGAFIPKRAWNRSALPCKFIVIVTVRIHGKPLIQMGNVRCRDRRFRSRGLRSGICCRLS